MARGSLYAEVDLREVSSAFRNQLRAAKDLRPVWREIRTPFRKAQARHIQEQRGPDGPWPKLARSTVAKRLKAVQSERKNFTKRGKLRKPVQRRLNRVLSRRLLNRLKFRARPHQAELEGRYGEVGGIHQLGGRAGRGARIPARTYLYPDQRVVAITVSAIERHLVGAFVPTRTGRR